MRLWVLQRVQVLQGSRCSGGKLQFDSLTLDGGVAKGIAALRFTTVPLPQCGSRIPEEGGDRGLGHGGSPAGGRGAHFAAPFQILGVTAV